MKMPRSFLRYFIVVLVILGTVSCGRFSRKPAGQRQAERLADAAIKSLGGQRALNAARFLVFDFVVEQNGRPVVTRSHTWDRKTGRYRLEGTTADGQPYVVLFNVNTRQGRVYAGTKLQEVANAGPALEAAYRDFQRDTAWLFGAFRLRDPGVQLAEGGQQVVGGRPYNVISATATGPAEGTLPGARNDVFLDPGTGRPFAWVFTAPGSQDQAVYIFTGFQDVGKLKLPTRLNRAGSASSISFGQIISLTNIGDNVFESISGPLVQKVRPLTPEEQKRGM